MIELYENRLSNWSASFLNVTNNGDEMRDRCGSLFHDVKDVGLAVIESFGTAKAIVNTIV